MILSRPRVSGWSWWLPGLTIVLSLLTAFPSRATSCEPGQSGECQSLQWQCTSCIQEPDSPDCEHVCSEAAACWSGYRVLSSWTRTVANNCTETEQQTCGIWTLYHNYYEYFVELELQFWELRECYDLSASFDFQSSASSLGYQFCWYHDGYCFTSFNPQSVGCTFSNVGTNCSL